jgi:hypothetical protein
MSSPGVVAPPPSGAHSFGQGAPPGYQYQYSMCTGMRKALLIGINYFGQRGELSGCINDVRNMSSYLVRHFGYKPEDMVILTDDQQNPISQPTKQNILRAMHWLVKSAKPNDSLFFHYSGRFLSFYTRVSLCFQAFYPGLFASQSPDIYTFASLLVLKRAER